LTPQCRFKEKSWQIVHVQEISTHELIFLAKGPCVWGGDNGKALENCNSFCFQVLFPGMTNSWVVFLNVFNFLGCLSECFHLGKRTFAM
jgi:hypothetical protein